MFRKISISYIISFFVSSLNAQDIPVNWINKNDLAGEQFYSNNFLKQDYFTGTANIHLPFFQYSAGGADLSVGLFYNTSGIEVDRIASNIGLGWEVSYGGTIERQIRGLPDDIYSAGCGGIFSGINTLYGYWFSGNNDPESDLFYLNISGRRIVFSFSKTGEVLTIPKAEVKIERYVNGLPYVNTSPPSATSDGDTYFKVIDEHGNKWTFKKGYRDKINQVYAGTFGYGACQRDYYPIDKWFVYQFESYEGKIVNYTYESVPQYTTKLHYSQVLWEKNGNYGEAQQKEIVKEYDFARIKKIEYPNNVDIEFQYDETISARLDLLYDLRLIGVKIKERNTLAGITPKERSFLFNQSYFLSPDRNIPISTTYNNGDPIEVSYNTSLSYIATQLRLKLNSIDEKGIGGQVRPWYNFQYSNIPIPERLYGVRDVFGYALEGTPQLYTNTNNLSYYLMVSPVHTIVNGSSSQQIGFNNNLSSSDLWAKAGILEKITNADKGVVSFQYSTNRVPINAGGLRIASIDYFDGYNHDNDLTYSYEYADGDRFLDEGSVVYGYIKGDPTECNGSNGSSENFTVFSNSSNILNKALNGTNYGYKTVDEIIKRTNGTQVAKTRYEFSGLNSNAQPIGSNILSPNGLDFNQAPFSNKQYVRFWGVGLPLKITRYNDLNIICSTEENAYNISLLKTEDLSNSNDWKNTAKLVKQTGCFYGVTDNYEDIHFPYTGLTLLTQIKSRVYTGGTAFIENVEDYTYDNHSNIATVTATNSLGESIITKNFYSYDFINGSYASPAINKLNQDNIQQLIYSQIEKAGKLFNVTAAGLDIVNGNVIRPTNSYGIKATTTLSPNPYSSGLIDQNLFSTTSPPPNFFYRGKVSRYDTKGFPLEIADQTATSYKSQIWDGQTELLLAEISNAKYDDIAYCGFESQYATSPSNKGNFDFNPSSISVLYSFLGRCSYLLSSGSGLWTTHNLTIGKKYIVSYWLKQGGTADVNDGINPIPNASSTKQLISSFNGWSLYKCTFTAQSSGIGLWGAGYVDELKVYPADAIMVTHNYLPLVGKTADVDNNDFITFYEYDDFGNQTIVKDHNGDILFKTKKTIQGND